MSHDYCKCKGCGKPVMEHVMNHTEKGSYCDACYRRLGLEPSDEDLGFKICSICGKKFLKRNFKTAYPDDVCGYCGEASLQTARTGEVKEVRDVPFYSEANQLRDVVLGFIHDREDKRVGMRVWHRQTNTVESVRIPMTDAYFWNVNFHGGTPVAKCCAVADFPVLYLPEGVVGSPLQPGVKLASKVAGAWVLGEHVDGRIRLISVGGLVKDVTKATALGYLTQYGIANAYADGANILAKQVGSFPVIKPVATFSIYQLKAGEEHRYRRFISYDTLLRQGEKPDIKNYDKVYSGVLAAGDTLDSIYMRFNINRPADFKGRSLSMSDVIVYPKNGVATAYYVDDLGFRECPEFLVSQTR